MKYLRGLAIVFVIFVLPAGSWYYLQSGYNYRLQALKELEPKGQVIELVQERANPDFLRDDVTLICLCDNISQKNLSTLTNIEEKIDTAGFQILQLKSSDQDYPKLSENYGTDPLILIDKDREVRNTYSFDEEVINDLIKHVAIVVPLPSRQKIKLKREG